MQTRLPQAMIQTRKAQHLTTLATALFFENNPYSYSDD